MGDEKNDQRKMLQAIEALKRLLVYADTNDLHGSVGVRVTRDRGRFGLVQTTIEKKLNQ